MHGTEAKCSDNRGVRIIEVRIIKVALYCSAVMVYIHVKYCSVVMVYIGAFH